MAVEYDFSNSKCFKDILEFGGWIAIKFTFEISELRRGGAKGIDSLIEQKKLV